MILLLMITSGKKYSVALVKVAVQLQKYTELQS